MVQRNIGTMKPDCEASEFQGSPENQDRGLGAYWGHMGFAVTLRRGRAFLIDPPIQRMLPA